jgi:hypothetical protein
MHVNTAECRFSLMKRAVFGTHHSISEAHLHPYLAERDYKFNARKIPTACLSRYLALSESALPIGGLVKPRTRLQARQAL